MECYVVTLAILRRRLIEYLNRSVSGGEFTERGLARRLGASQPHIHNVLKGAKAMSIELADHILLQLRIPIGKLLTDAEIDELTKFRRKPPGSASHAIPECDSDRRAG